MVERDIGHIPKPTDIGKYDGQSGENEIGDLTDIIGLNPHAFDLEEPSISLVEPIMKKIQDINFPEKNDTNS